MEREHKFERIEELAEKMNGIVTTKQVEESGISRVTLQKYVQEGKLIKESQGIYSLATEFPDEYKLLQMRSEKMIFSYGTALYLWGMSDRIPRVIDVTVPQGYNVSRIKKNNPEVRFHYAGVEKWNVGITETVTPLGNKVKVFDKERCICDLIQAKEEVDKQLYIQAIKNYFKGEWDARKILKYAKLFQIETQIREYMEILT